MSINLIYLKIINYSACCRAEVTSDEISAMVTFCLAHNIGSYQDGFKQFSLIYLNMGKFIVLKPFLLHQSVVIQNNKNMAFGKNLLTSPSVSGLASIYQKIPLNSSCGLN